MFKLFSVLIIARYLGLMIWGEHMRVNFEVHCIEDTTLEATNVELNTVVDAASTNTLNDKLPSPSAYLGNDIFQNPMKFVGFNFNETPLNSAAQLRNLFETNLERMKLGVDPMKILESANLSGFSSQQMGLMNDMLSMLQQQSDIYGKINSEKKIHEECFASAYQDLQSAIEIMTKQQQTSGNNVPLEQVRDRILSAVGHLRDSCPLCRALKNAINNNDDNSLLFFTTLSASILKSLHPTIQTP